MNAVVVEPKGPTYDLLLVCGISLLLSSFLLGFKNKDEGKFSASFQEAQQGTSVLNPTVLNQEYWGQ